MDQPNREAQVRYMKMLIQQEEIHWAYNISASISTWFILVGYLSFPGTFTSLEGKTTGHEVGKVIYDNVKNIPLLVIAAVLCAIGCAGCGWLWWRWNENFIWLGRHIFLYVISSTWEFISNNLRPVFTTSITGLASTLSAVYSSHHGQWSVTARFTAAATGSFAILTGGIFIYNDWRLTGLKNSAMAGSKSGMRKLLERWIPA